MTDKKKAAEKPKEDDPSVGVTLNKEGPFIEVRVNSVWAAAYTDGQIASAIRLFHRPEFITDLMVNSAHEAIKAAGCKWQGTAATSARKKVGKAVEGKQASKPAKGKKKEG